MPKALESQSAADAAPSVLERLLEQPGIALDELCGELLCLPQAECDQLLSIVFHPAERVRLHVRHDQLSCFVRILCARTVVGFAPVAVLDKDGKPKLEKNGTIKTRKMTPTPELLLEAAKMAAGDFAITYADGLATLHKTAASVLSNMTSHVHRMSSARLPGVVRAPRDTQAELPWLGTAHTHNYPGIAYSGAANMMKGREIFSSCFWLEDRVTSVFELLLADDPTTVEILSTHGILPGDVIEQFRGKPFSQFPETVGAGAPQLLWDTPQGTVSITPVPPVSLLSLLHTLGRNGVPAERVVYGGSKPQNVSAFNQSAGALATLKSRVPTLSMLPPAVLLDRLFAPNSLITRGKPWCKPDVFARLPGLPNAWVKRTLRRMARDAVSALAAPLFQARELLEANSPLLTERHREHLAGAEHPILLYLQGIAEHSHVREVALRVFELALQTQRESALSAEWRAYFLALLVQELDQSA